MVKEPESKHNANKFINRARIWNLICFGFLVQQKVSTFCPRRCKQEQEASRHKCWHSERLWSYAIWRCQGQRGSQPEAMFFWSERDTVLCAIEMAYTEWKCLRHWAVCTRKSVIPTSIIGLCVIPTVIMNFRGKIHTTRKVRDACDASQILNWLVFIAWSTWAETGTWSDSATLPNWAEEFASSVSIAFWPYQEQHAWHNYKAVHTRAQIPVSHAKKIILAFSK